MIHQRKHPNLDIEDCFGCKIASINFGTVPGGAKDQRTNISGYNQRERDLHRYREKRRAGEQPDGTTKSAMDRSERKQDLYLQRERDLLDYNPPETVKSVRKSLTNSA